MSHNQSRLAKKRRARRSVVTSTTGASADKHDPPPDEPLSHQELNRFFSIKKAAEYLDCHEDTARHLLAEHIELVGKRRIAVRYKHLIAARPAPRPAERSAA